MASEVTPADHVTIDEFLGTYFLLTIRSHPVPNEDSESITFALKYVSERFDGMTYILGLALDFTLLAQALSTVHPAAKGSRPNLTARELFSVYTLITKRGGRVANTLTVQFKDDEFGIRKFEEKVVQLFHRLNRTGYPSAYVYNTGQWQKYRELLLACFRLSERGRLLLCEQLIDLGAKNLETNSYFQGQGPRPRLFESLLRDYPRSGENENAGLTFQALTFGYVQADRPHLSLIGDKVRTGSARQKRIGDIDGYLGLDLELSVEVKDIHITDENLNRELGGFANEVGRHGCFGLAVVQAMDEAPRKALDEKGVRVLDLPTMLAQVAIWDWRKQDLAFLGVLHHLAHIEQNPAAVQRLLAFIEQIDPDHDQTRFRLAVKD